eukprot:snap_masked-scaffold_26-processed-gene-2.37-mRNA-1 protein AED:1.00 eAED:1.00 QI:0/0/0/0/1/1/6/0/143
MNSIKQQYEERDNKTTFEIEWEHVDVKTPINPNKFKREIEEFVKGFQPTQDVSSLEFLYCPLYAVKSIFVRLILCFTAVKKLRFWYCRFSDENFKNLQKLKKVKLNYLKFFGCKIPEVSSFCSLLNSINIKDIQLRSNQFSAK